MTSAADVPQIDSDPCPVTLINFFEIDSDKLDLFFAGVTGHPALYRVALEVTAPELSEQQTLND